MALENIRPIGVDLEETLIRYPTISREIETAELRPGAIILLEGLKKIRTRTRIRYNV